MQFMSGIYAEKAFVQHLCFSSLRYQNFVESKYKWIRNKPLRASARKRFIIPSNLPCEVFYIKDHAMISNNEIRLFLFFCPDPYQFCRQQCALRDPDQV